MAVGTLDQHQDSEGTNFGFGQFAVVRYRGQNFTPALAGSLGSLGFSRDLPSADIKVYIDTVDGSHLPVHAVGSELYSWIIPHAQFSTNYQVFDLPTPLPLTVGTEYCFYLAPFSGGVYSDDYHDCHGINTTPGGKEVTNSNGSWSTETLTFHFATYMQAAVTAPSAPGLGFHPGRGPTRARFIKQKLSPSNQFLPILIESIAVTDALTKQTGKALPETVTVTDALSKQTNRPLSESIAISDSLAKLTSRAFTETLTITDSLSKQAQKVFAETVTFTDSLLKKAQKVLTETVTMTDTLVKQIQRVFTETITITDSIAKQAQKVLSEAVTLTDSLVRQTQKTLTEVITISDTLFKITSKALTETITMSDVLAAVKQAGTHVHNYYTGGIAAAKRMMRGIGF